MLLLGERGTRAQTYPELPDAVIGTIPPNWITARTWAKVNVNLQMPPLDLTNVEVFS